MNLTPAKLRLLRDVMKKMHARGIEISVLVA